MKIRLFEGSIRVRLNQAEVASLAGGGEIEMVTPMAGSAVSCTVQTASGGLQAHHAAGRITVMIPIAECERWAASGEEGLYAKQVLEGSQVLKIAVEKDYRCIHKPDSPDSAGTFPNPAPPPPAAKTGE